MFQCFNKIMWVRKTKEEISKTKQDRKPYVKYSAIIAVVFLVFQIIANKLGFSRLGDFDALSWREISIRLPIYLLFSASIFIVFFLLQVTLKKSIKPEETTYICDRCNNKKLDDGKYNCECGGEFIHINLMK